MSSRTGILTAAALMLATALPALAQDRESDPQESYSYVRVLDGRATLASEGSGPGDDAEVNQPLMTGDRVTVARGARLEIALADRNLLRVGGDSALTLAQVAYSGDRDARSTRIDLDEGELLLIVTDDALGDSLPEVRTPQAEVVIHRPGNYRIESRAEGWTEVVVREGYAELVTGQGSTIVREGESAWASEDRQDVDLAEAGSFDALERWSDDLGRQAERARAAVLHVEPDFAYSAAPLADYGSWVTVDASWYWQPRVEVGWRPYWRGRWGWTPSGLTWISSEPWGWLPYHYGSWLILPGHGWVWRPGRVYAPAWVYWHWTDDWVGWCPTGYYTSWYGGGFGFSDFRWGVYGWAGGGWGSYYDWNFVPTRHLRHHDQRPWMRRGHDLERELGHRIPRGVLTTDTRGLPRDRFADPGVGTEELLRRVRAQRGGDLPDVTDFVARRRELPPQVVDAVRPEPGSRIRLAGERGNGRDLNPRTVPPVTGRRTAGQSGEGGAVGGGGIDNRNSPPRDGRLFDRERPGGQGTVDNGNGRDFNPRSVPPVTGRRPAGQSGEGGAVGGGGIDNRNSPPRDGRLFDRERPRGEGAPPAGNGNVDRPRANRPPDSGVERPAPRPTDERGRPTDRRNQRPADVARPRSSEPLPPGGSVEIDGSGRVRPVDRQGWRGREGWTGAPGGSAAPRYAPRSEEPVQRVLGGIRRYDGGAQNTYERQGAPRWTPPVTAPTPRTNDAAPRWTPRSAPPSYAPRSTPPSYAPRSSPPSYAPRSTPTPSTPSRPSAAPAPRPSPPPTASSGSRSSSPGHSSPPPRRTDRNRD